MAALNFVSGSTDRVDYGSAAVFDNIATSTRNSQLTAMGWVYATSFADGRTIVSKFRNGNSGWVCRLFGATGDLNFQIFRTVNFTYTTTDAPVATNTWTFVACVADLTATNVGHIYTGTLTSLVKERSYSGTATAGSGNVTDDSARSLFAGNGDRAAIIDGWPGRVAWVGVWDRALSLGEVRDQQFHPHKTSGNILFSHLGFNGTGAQADWSGFKNNGTVTGATLAPHVPLGAPFTGASAGESEGLAYNPFKMDRMLAIRDSFDSSPLVLARRLKFYF